MTRSHSGGDGGLLGRPFKRSWLRPLIRAAMIVGLVVLVAVGAAIAVVLSGPTEIGILRGRVEETVAQALGSGYKVSVGRTTVDIDPALGLVVMVDDVTVRDSGDNLVATVPSTRLAVDPVALLTFHGLIRSVELNSPEISFTRRADGRVMLGRLGEQKPGLAPEAFAAAGAPVPTAAPPDPVPAATAKPRPSAGGFPDLLAALQILDTGIEPSVQAALRAGFERFAMVQANIDIADATYAEERHLPRTDLTMAVDPRTAAITINLTASGYSGRWTATAERSVDAGTGERFLSANFSQLTLADIFPRYSSADAPMASDVPLYGRVNVKLGVDGAVEEATARLDLGAGTFEFRPGKETMLLDEATIQLHWDLAKNELVIDPSPFSSAQSHGTITGSIQPIGDPSARRYSYQLESQDAVLAARDNNAPPVKTSRMAVNGTLDIPAKLLTFDNAVLTSPSGSVTGSGSLDFNGASPAAKLNASMSPMPVEVAKQIWPPFIAGSARKWVVEHVTTGKIVSGKMMANIPAGVIWTGQRNPITDDQLRVDFRLENVSFTTLGDVPPIVNAYGNAALAGSTFGIDIEKGQVITPSGRKVDVTAGAFAVPNLVPVIPDGRVELQMAGDAAGLAEIADAYPFNALKRQKISATALSGTGTASLSARWPMRLGLTEADVDWRVSVNVANFASKEQILGRTISEGKVNIVVNPDDLSIVGRAKIDGVVADVNLVQPIHEDGATPAPGKRLVRMTLDEQARKRMGMGLDDVIGGTLDAAITDSQYGNKAQRYEIDLRRARLTLSALGWSKGVGVPAKLSFDLVTVPEGYRVENISLQGDGFSLTGKALFDSKYQLISADVSNLSLRKGDDVAFTLKRDNKAGYIISASGKNFDIRGLMQRVQKPFTANSAAPDLMLDAKVDKVIGFNNEALSKGEISLGMTGGQLRKFDLKGTLGSSQASASYLDQPQGTNLNVSTNDAGALFRFVGLYPKVAGGALNLQGQRTGDAPMIGTFDVSNFSIVGEQVMARFASTTDRSDGFNPNSVPFTRMQLNFTQQNSLIVIDDAVIKSNSIGATFEGRLDLAASQILLQGTYLPAYPLNNMFGKIPVLGLALGGGSKGGLVGVTFRVEGDLNGPAIQINPLSAIAPGIFRKIFEFH